MDIPPSSLAVILALLVVAVVAILVNTSVMVLFVRNRQLRTPSNSMLASLSVCDLFGGASALIVIATTYVSTAEVLVEQGPAMFALRLCESAMVNLANFTTVLHLCMITADRYVAIEYSLRYHEIMTRAVARRSIVAAWVTGFGLTAAQTALHSAVLFSHGVERRHAAFVAATLYGITTEVLFVVSPAALLGIVYIHLFLVVRKLSRGGPAHIRPTQDGPRSRRALTIFFCLYSTFVVCWMPSFVLKLAVNVMLVLGSTIDVSSLDVAVLAVIFLRYSTTIANPLLYTLMKSEFRAFLCKRMRLEASIDAENNAVFVQGSS